MNPTKERELLDVLSAAERSADTKATESAVNELALYYVETNQFPAAIPFWRRGTELLAKSTDPNSAELGTYLQNMAELCLLPAGLRDEARTALIKAREIYGFHFRSDSKPLSDVDELLKRLSS